MKYLKNVATLKYNEAKCTGCGRCAEVCPHRIFKVREKKAVLTDRDLCIECGACMMNCPAEAIDVEVGVGCAAAVIGAMLGKSKTACCG
ncbi:MAG: ferredoxin [Elusimicrobia bacterium RIFOXYA1_FULL_47_7]|nr:MAG: ferredoxin [Elusimicrobia bacterium RIFOXYA12_FULL_49_49]OGS07023.1 MAG: ferredoxin [Elusimicrobia bacterium RIFOXYA1_FULL_47_7]OGS10054.1 MAG: ferredoxin [Elusimicrobia bacterium RIFOXYB1_FULL_48_9]OGS16463.1 MAG: ferredoxin [Elusimicrobia bacterium RIFOXYA2_FULL_47_53]OGS26032.1 MAG: ferredoxin [Elusimicrobia bacterium RIFOXYB12_FULL_50_12]OGS29649.1 MAG: ferredoxin [Elusimicrobia bacterium RIFOXYB2_FULL_46_23]